MDLTKRESIRVSNYLDELSQAIQNDKELTDIATEVTGLGLHTYWLGLELQKRPGFEDIAKRMVELGTRYHQHGGDLQAIALHRGRANAAD